MTITNRQKNIINPLARTYVDDENSPTRRGVGYNYDDLRNKFVIDSIHESYISYYEFPAIGDRLFPGETPPEDSGAIHLIVEENGERQYTTFTKDDFLAYSALYPQNAKVQTISRDTSVVEILSEEEAEEELRGIVQRINENEGYFTDTAPESYGLANPAPFRKLISIPAEHSAEYIRDLRRSLGKENIPPNNTDLSFNSTIIPPELTGLVSSNSNIDIDNWVNNTEPGTETTKTYFNPRDNKYYFVKRTTHTSPHYYDLQQYDFDESPLIPGTQRPEGFEIVKQNIERAMAEGVEGILKSCGKYDVAGNNKREILNSSPKKAYFLAHKEVRPASRWVYAVTVDRSDIDSIGDSGQSLVSYEETELTPLQKSEIIVDPEKVSVAKKATFILDDLLVYLRSTRIILESVAEDMAEEGIYSLPYENTNNVGVDNQTKSGKFLISEEIGRLSVFPDAITTFMLYNKRTLDEDSVIELYLDSQNKLLYVCVNGELLTRGTGNLLFSNLQNEEQGIITILSAFGMMTSTTFNYLLNSKKIHELYNQNGTTVAAGIEWAQFLPEYTYPPLEMDPELLELATRQQTDSLQRKKSLFVEIAKRNTISPGELERIYELKFSDPNWIRMRTTALLSGMNCDTALGFLATTGVGFWNAANEKKNIKAIVRETIKLLRAGISHDQALFYKMGLSQSQGQAGNYLADRISQYNEVLDLDSTRRPNQNFKEYLDGVVQNQQNQQVIARDFDRWVNSQILCSVDVVGNFLEESFLDPIGSPPQINSLVREIVNDARPRVKIKAQPMFSTKLKASKVYENVIKEMISQAIKAFVAGIAKDLIKAILGCAPPDEQRDQLQNFIRQYDYGLAMLSEHVEGIDLRAIALQSGLVTVIENDTAVPPTPEQMQAILKDVSVMCTPVELQQLLFGDGSLVLYELLNETLNNGEVKVKTGEEKDNNGELQPIFHYIRPQVYASVNITKDIIRSFFENVGRAMTPNEKGNVDEFSFQSPLEAYCNSRDPDLASLKLNVSIGQLQEQYAMSVDDRINKINGLCGFLSDLTRLEQDIQRIFSALPILNWYDDMLRLLTGLNAALENWLSDRLSNLFPQEPPRALTNVNNFYSTKMGAELYFQIRDNLRSLNTFQVVTLPDTGRPPLNNQYYEEDSDTGLPEDFANDWTFYVLGGSQGVISHDSNQRDSQNLEDGLLVTEARLYGIPFIDAGQRISYTRSNTSMYRWVTTPGEYSKFNLPLPFQSIETPPGPGYTGLPAGNYSSRTAPWAYREALDNGFLVGEPPNDLESMLAYGEKVLDKIGRSSWDQEPYTGFVSPVFVSSHNLDNSFSKGVSFYGINPKTGKPRYEKLCHWVPNVGNPFRLFLDGDQEFSSDSRFPLNGNNVALTYGISYAGWGPANGYSPVLVGQGELPSVENPQVQQLMNLFFQGFIEPGERSPETEPSVPLVSISHWKMTPETSLDQVYFTAAGKRRLPQYISSINRAPLKVLDDECVTKEEVKKAQSVMEIVQVRMQQLFLNAMPISRVYLCWNNLSTVTLVSNYMTTQITKKLKNDGYLGLVYQNMDIVKKVYADEEDNNINFLSTNTPQQNFEEFVRGIFVGMLNNIANGSEYTSINKSVYSYFSEDYNLKTGFTNQTLDRYMKTLEIFFDKMIEQLSDEGNGITYGLGNIPETIELLTNIRNSENLKAVGHYYFPIGVLTAARIIYYDYSINSAGRFSDTNYRLQLEEAGAYDALISATRGIPTNENTIKFSGFPQTVTTYTGDNEIIYFNTVEVSRRLSVLNNLLEDTFEPWPISIRDYSNLSRENYETYILPGLRNLYGNEDWFQEYVDYWYDSLKNNRNREDIRDANYGIIVEWLLEASPDQISNENWSDETSFLVNYRDIIPSIWTTPAYYQNMADFIRLHVDEIANARFAIAQDEDYQQTDAERNRLSRQDMVWSYLITAYSNFTIEAGTLENIRTERNQLEILIN